MLLVRILLKNKTLGSCLHINKMEKMTMKKKALLFMQLRNIKKEVG